MATSPRLSSPLVQAHVPSIHLTTLAEDAVIARCDQIAQTEARRPFDLAAPPLIRVTHVRLRRDLAILLVTAHHTVCDGWSIGLLAAEMGEICAALQAGRPPDLSDLPVTYGEFSTRQRQLVAAGNLAEDERYWARALEGMSYFELPPDRARSRSLASRRYPLAAAGSRADGWARRALPPAWLHLVHDRADRVADIAAPLYRRERYRHRYAGDRPQ